MSIPFHSTVMGRKFYEHDVPKLIRALEKIGKELEIARSPLEEEPRRDTEKVTPRSVREVLRGLRRVAAVYEHEFRDIETATLLRQIIRRVMSDLKVEENEDGEA